jgi:hypothetical protein
MVNLMSSHTRATIRRYALIPLLLALTSFANVATACRSDGPTGACCKVCKEGKPCGDTCIAKTDVCHTSGGCACAG